MKSFAKLTAISAALPIENIDTDKILPGQFLKTISREGLGEFLFWTLRQDPSFILNRAPWNEAKILIALDNFGCGSSREHAPWALLDFGISCVIAPQIADIFYNNCFKNGILPIQLPRDDINHLMALAENSETATLRIDLMDQSVTAADGRVYHFEVDSARKADLLAGADDISRTLDKDADISAFEAAQQRDCPWAADTRQALLVG